MGVDLDGARVLLTGASSGIGAALAPLLAARGAVVGLVGRRADRLESVRATCTGSGHRAWSHDLSDVDGSVALLDRVRDELGGIEVLVNNAAVPKRRHIADLTPDELEHTMTVNFTSPARLCMALLPHFVEQGRGMFVNVASMGGRTGIPDEAAYCASKFALCGFTEALAIDLWDSPLQVRLIVPGPVDTEIWDRPGNDTAHYDGPLTPAAEVAAGIVDAIEGDRFEAYLPDLKGVAEFKTSDPEAFLAGAAEMAGRKDGAP